jgi:hypothetical protein
MPVVHTVVTCNWLVQETRYHVKSKELNCIIFITIFISVTNVLLLLVLLLYLFLSLL